MKNNRTTWVYILHFVKCFRYSFFASIIVYCMTLKIKLVMINSQIKYRTQLDFTQTKIKKLAK